MFNVTVVWVVCIHSREIQMTKTLVAMLDDRNNKSSNMAAMTSVASDLLQAVYSNHSLVTRGAFL